MKRSLLAVVLLTGCVPGEASRVRLLPLQPRIPLLRAIFGARATADAGPPPTSSWRAPAAFGFDNIDEVEARFIAPRCGQAKCHGPISVFPPKTSTW